jgi:glutathione S-transferase
VLVDGDLTLFDSTLIFEYLEDAYPVPPLYPATAAARARCRRLELIADEILLPPLVKLMYRTTPPDPDLERQRAREADGARAEEALLAHYAGLARELAGRDYFCGDFSVADIGLFMTLLFVLRLAGPPFTEHPPLVAWYARMGQRAAVARAAAEIAAEDRRLSPPVARP